MVHEAGRPDPGVRVELWGCEPAGACVGDVQGFQDREEVVWERGFTVFGEGVPETVVEFYLVGFTPFLHVSYRVIADLCCFVWRGVVVWRNVWMSGG